MALILTVDFVPLSSQPCPNPLLPDLGSLSQLFTFFWYSISQTVICKEAESESSGKLSDNTDSETISITATLNIKIGMFLFSKDIAMNGIRSPTNSCWCPNPRCDGIWKWGPLEVIIFR